MQGHRLDPWSGSSHKIVCAAQHGQDYIHAYRNILGNSLAVPWLGFHALTAEGPGSVPGQGTDKSRKPKIRNKKRLRSGHFLKQQSGSGAVSSGVRLEVGKQGGQSGGSTGGSEVSGREEIEADARPGPAGVQSASARLEHSSQPFRPWLGFSCRTQTK